MRRKNEFFGVFILRISLTANLFIFFGTAYIFKNPVFAELSITKIKIQAAFLVLVIASSFLLDIDRLDRQWRISWCVLTGFDNRR